MAAGFTYIRYGDLQLFNVATKEFRQEAEFDQTGTDLLFYRYTIRVVGYFTGRGNIDLSSVPPNYFNPSTWIRPTNTDQKAGKHHAITQFRIAPRQNFEMWVGAAYDVAGNVDLVTKGASAVLVVISSGESNQQSWRMRDLNSGPKVKVLSVPMVVSNNLFRGEFEFEVCALPCNEIQADGIQSLNGVAVLSNRWSVVDEIDQNFFTTRTYTGRLRMATPVVSPHSFRGSVVPPLQQGLKRQSMRFVASDDGLNLLYEVVDREIAFSAPEPATSWEFEQTERVQRADQLGNYVDLRISLAGDRNVDRRKLIQIAFSIIDFKIFRFNNLQNNAYVESIAIRDLYGEGAGGITVEATARRVGRPGGGLGAIFQLQLEGLGEPITQQMMGNAVNQYDSRKSRGSRDGESLEVEGPVSMVGAFSVYLQSPCNSDGHKISYGELPAEQSPPDQTDVASVEAYVVGELVDDGSLDSYSVEQNDAGYITYQYESTYSTNSLRAACPIALGSNSQSSASQDTTSVVVLGQGQTKRKVHVLAERVGEPPDMLNPPSQFQDENGITHTLLDSHFMISTGEPTPDGNRTHRAHYEIEFAMSRAITAVANSTLIGVAETLILRAGANQWESSDLYSRIFGPKSEQDLTGS